MSDTDINVSGISSADGPRRTGYVFISYKSQQDEEAKRLQQYLEGKGFPCWRAPGSLHKRGTQDYSNDIFKAIRESNCLLFVLSDAALGSDWVQREVNYALNTCHKPVIPFVIDQIPVAKKESNGVYISLQLEKQILNEDLSWKMDVMLPYLENAFGGDGANAEAAKEKKEIPLRSCSQSEWKLWQDKADFHLARLNELAKIDILRPTTAELAPEAREVEIRLSANEAAEALIRLISSVPDNAAEWVNREVPSVRRQAMNSLAKLTYDYGNRFSPFVYSSVKPFAEVGTPWANFVLHAKFYSGVDDWFLNDDDDSSGKVFPYLQKAVLDEGNPWAFLRMGECWQWGTGCEVSGTQARFWYEKAVKIGCDEAQFCLARLYDFAPAGIRRDVDRARQYAERGVKADNARSYWMLGSLDEDKYFSSQDADLLSNVEKNFISAYDKGWGRALFDIAYIHLYDNEHTYSDDRFSDFKRICWTMKRAGIRNASYLLALKEIVGQSDSPKAASIYALAGCRSKDWDAMDVYANLLVAEDCETMSSHRELSWEPIFDWLDKKMPEVMSSELSSFSHYLRGRQVRPAESWDWVKANDYPQTAFWRTLTETESSVSEIKRTHLDPSAEFLSVLRNISLSGANSEFAAVKDIWELIRLLDWELATAKALDEGAADVFPSEFFDGSPSRLKRILAILLSRMDIIPNAPAVYQKIQELVRQAEIKGELPLQKVEKELGQLRNHFRDSIAEEDATAKGLYSPLEVAILLGEIERLVSPPVFAAAMTFCRRAFDSIGGSNFASHFAHLFLVLNARHFDQDRNEGMLFGVRDILLKGILLGNMSCAPLYLELCLLGINIGKAHLQADFSLIEKIEPYLFELVEDNSNNMQTHAEVAFGMAKIFLDKELFHMSRAESWGHVSLYDETKGLIWLDKARSLAQEAEATQIMEMAQKMIRELSEAGVSMSVSEELGKRMTESLSIDEQAMPSKSGRDFAIKVLANQIPPDVDAMAFKHVSLDGLTLDLAVSSDDVAVLFAVYPEDEDYMACPREANDEASETMEEEIPASKMDLLVRQREALQKLEPEAELHIAIIASTKTLESMRDVWGGELKEKKIELVEYPDFEVFLRKYFPLLPQSDDDENDTPDNGDKNGEREGTDAQE